MYVYMHRAEGWRNVVGMLLDSVSVRTCLNNIYICIYIYIHHAEGLRHFVGFAYVTTGAEATAEDTANNVSPREVVRARIRNEADGAWLKCVAVCCSVLQCVAVCCSVLQSVAVRCSLL